MRNVEEKLIQGAVFANYLSKVSIFGARVVHMEVIMIIFSGGSKVKIHVQQVVAINAKIVCFKVS
jgi:hypothetical protein